MAGRALLGVSHQEGAKRRGVVLCTCAVESTCPGPTTPIAREMRTLQLQVENGTSALEIGLVVSHKATSASTLRPSHPSPRLFTKRNQNQVLGGEPTQAHISSCPLFIIGKS